MTSTCDICKTNFKTSTGATSKRHLASKKHQLALSKIEKPTPQTNTDKSELINYFEKSNLDNNIIESKMEFKTDFKDNQQFDTTNICSGVENIKQKINKYSRVGNPFDYDEKLLDLSNGLSEGQFRTQQPMFEYMEEHKHAIPAKITNKIFTSFVDGYEFMDAINEDSNPMYYELLQADKPQRMFAELDGALPLNGMDLDGVVATFENFIADGLRTLDIKYNPARSRWTTASTNKKLSIHWVYLDYTFENCDIQKQFWHYMETIQATSYPQLDIFAEHGSNHVIKSVIDLGVYTRNRAMRTIYSTKEGQQRPLIPFEFNNGIVEKLKKADDDTEYLIFQPDAKEFCNINLPDFQELKHPILKRDVIEELIYNNIDNVQIKQYTPPFIGLKTVGIRTCIINGEDNKSDNCFVVIRRDGLYFCCHDEECHGERKKFADIETRAKLAPRTRLARVEGREVKNQSNFSNVLLSDFNDHLLAMAFLRLPEYKDRLIYYHEFYHFSGHYWHPIHENHIFEAISTTLFNLLKTEANNTYGNDVNDMKKYSEIIKKLSKLGSWNSRKGIVKSIEAIVQWKDTAKIPFDGNTLLLGFRNGVIDLDSDELKLRAGRPEDMISKVCPYNYDLPDAKKLDELRDVYDRIMPHEDERQLLFRCISTALSGEVLDNVIILTGCGRNGKDTTITNLVKAVLGNSLYYPLATAAVCQTIKETNASNPELAGCSDKRLVVVNEPDSGMELNRETLKAITGGNVIKARMNYSNNSNVRTSMSLFVLANKIPKVKMDMALYERIIIVPFRAKFRSQKWLDRHPEDKYAHLKETKYKSEAWADDYKLEMLHLILEQWRYFRRDGYIIKNVPASCEKLKESYTNDCGDIMGWISGAFEFTDNEKNDYVKIKEIHNAFKMSGTFNELTKKDKRELGVLSKFKKWILEHPTLSEMYRDRVQPMINGKQKCIRGVLVGLKWRPEDEESDDDE